ncbi:MAG TPA: lipopolysaccharide heptosyltransferase II [Nevskiaceae bacterium]|nr:lipopolysaccharide heptosyltransferase II [Nevskiaceae bacterium]
MNDRVLVVGPSWVGDMVMAQSLFMRLQQLRPDCEIDVLAPGWSLPLIARMREVRAGIEMPLGHGAFGFSVRRTLGHSLREKNYTQAIVLPGSWKSALVPFFARIPRRTGYRGEMRYGLLNDIRALDKNLLKTTVQRFVALAEEGSVSVVPAVPEPRFAVKGSIAVAAASVQGHGTALVGLLPGAEYGPAKQWPAAHYGELAKLLARQNVTCLVFGSKKEQALGEEIRVASGNTAVNLCGQTTLTELVDALAQCKAVVTNDSGPMHVAAAAGVPLVAIYGSSTPDFTPPLTARSRIHYLRLACSPCFERTCPLGHYNCLRQIGAAAVRQSLHELAGV